MVERVGPGIPERASVGKRADPHRIQNDERDGHAQRIPTRGTLTDVSEENLREAFESAVDRWAPRARVVVVGVSGGPDSVALFRLCAAARSHGQFAELHAVHLDHGLRDGSHEDARFVRDLAAAHDVSVHVEAIDVGAVAKERGWNLAAGARRLRYELLSRIARAQGADVIFTGHTADDQAETVLHQLARGAAFLSGIPPRRGRVVRPLLEVRRHDILAYLEQIGQLYVEDPSNRDLALLRPWLRHDVLPSLEARVPGTVGALARHADVQREARAFMTDEAERRLGTEPIDAMRLAEAPLALQRQAIVGLLERHGAPVDFARVERILVSVRDRATTRIDIGEGVTVRLAYGQLDVVGEPSRPVEERTVEAEADLPEGAPTSLLVLDGPLHVRARRTGDVIRLPGGSKSVADLMIDRKVPRESRDALPLVARGSEVLWIEGVASSVEVEAPHDPDDVAMVQALEVAERGGARGELPVGAVILVRGEPIAEAHNETDAAGDPTAHAELLALQRAAAEHGRHALRDATLVVTLEPCPMCLGAVLQAHVKRVVYGARNRRDGALGGVTDLTTVPWKRSLDVRGGVRAGEASELLTRFFRERRG